MPRGGKRPGAGRPLGSPNKYNADIKSMVLTALSNAGGADYLTEQAKKNPVAFMGLVGKVLPLTIANADDKPLRITFEWADAAPLVIEHDERNEPEPEPVYLDAAD